MLGWNPKLGILKMNGVAQSLLPLSDLLCSPAAGSLSLRGLDGLDGNGLGLCPNGMSPSLNLQVCGAALCGC